MITKKEKNQIIKNIEYSGDYAISNLWMGNKLNLYLFNEMKRNGYKLVTVDFAKAYFVLLGADE